MYTASGTLDKDHLVTHYAGLVRRIAQHMMVRLPPSVQIGDLLQAGYMGLMDAAARYQEEQGVQFEAYAAQRIRGAILDELRTGDWLPRGARKSQREIEAALARLEQRLGRAPRESEIARELKLSLEDYQALLGDVQGLQLLHYEDFSADGEGLDFHERIAGDGEGGGDPLAMLSDTRFRRALIDAVEVLPEREKMVMGM